MGRRNRLYPSVLALAILASSLSISGQEPAPRFRVSSNMILVDVRVLDSRGLPVTGLKREDFKVFEEGIPQSVVYFQEVSLPLAPSAAANTAASPAAAGREREPNRARPADLGSASKQPSSDLPQALPDKRIMILLFNLSSMSPQDSAEARRAAREFIEKNQTPLDSVAVLAFDQGLSLLADLTTRRDVLLKAIDRIGQPSPETDLSLPSDQPGGDTGTASEYLADDTEFSLFSTNQQLSAVQAVADAYKDIPGRKSLIYFSSGMTLQGVDNLDQLRWTTDLANRTNFSIYPVDSRGLVALSPGEGAHRGTPRGTGIYSGSAGLQAMAALSSSQEPLVAMAADTGGQALLDDNRVGKIFQTVQEDSSHYYLLGYRSPEVRPDGKFRRIEVTVDVPHVQLSYRHGYYSDKPYPSLSTIEREQSFQQAILEDRWFADFPVSMDVESFPQESGKFLVPVFLSFQSGSLTEKSADRLNLELILLARDDQRRVVAGLRDHVEIRPRRTAGEARFLYQNLMQLASGSYELVAYLRDNRSGAIAKQVAGIKLESEGPITPGTVILSSRWEDPGEMPSSFSIKTGRETTLRENPMIVGGKLLVPHVDETFLPTDPFYFYGRLRGPAGSAQGRFRILLRNAAGETLESSDWKPLRPAESPQMWDYSGKIPLAHLSSGSYRLEVQVRIADREKLIEREFQVH